MEIKEKQQINKKARKLKVDIKSNEGVISQALKLYVSKLKIVHIVVFVVVIIFYISAFYVTFNKIGNGNYFISDGTIAKGFVGMFNENIALSFIIILAGITPFFYLSILGVAQPTLLVDQIALRYIFHSTHPVTGFIGGMIEMVGLSLYIAVGLYFCKLSTKKNKYYHQSDFGIDDLKTTFYDLRKDNKKIEEMKLKKEKKAKKIEESNVKIPIVSFIILGLIGFIIEMIGALIVLI